MLLKEFDSPDGALYRINFVGAVQNFADGVYGVPVGDWFVVATFSTDVAGPFDTIVAYLLDRDGKFECYNME